VPVPERWRLDAARYARWLGPDVEPEDLGRRWALGGRLLAVDDILAAEVAERMHAFLDHEMPGDWWSVVTSGPGGRVTLRDRPEHRAAIAEAQAANGRMREVEGRRFEGSIYYPAYTFKRTFDDHAPSCPCPLCDFRGFLGSEPLRALVRTIAGQAYEAREVFASKYTPGDHLDAHSDSFAGRSIAFVFGFTKGWEARHGGLLVMKEQREHRVFVPSYNRLLMFAVTGDAREHWVSDVTPDAGDRKRLSVSGWFG
jgi:hypothetical protein